MLAGYKDQHHIYAYPEVSRAHTIKVGAVCILHLRGFKEIRASAAERFISVYKYKSYLNFKRILNVDIFLEISY